MPRSSRPRPSGPTPEAGGDLPGTAVAWAAALLAVAACAAPDREVRPPLSDSTYVSVMARLAALDADFGASRTRGAPPPDLPPDSARGLVLRGHGVTETELLHFSREASKDPARMQRLWEEIAERADSLEAAGWHPEGEP